MLTLQTSFTDQAVGWSVSPMNLSDGTVRASLSRYVCMHLYYRYRSIENNK